MSEGPSDFKVALQHRIGTARSNLKESQFLARNLPIWALVSAVTASVVALLHVAQTFPGFFAEAVRPWGVVYALATVLVTLVFTAGLGVLGGAKFNKARQILVAFLLAIGIPTLLQSDLPVLSALGTAPQAAPLPELNVNVGNLVWTPLTDTLRQQMDHSVRPAKRREIDALDARFGSEEGVALLTREYIKSVQLSASLNEPQRDAQISWAQELRASDQLSPADKVQQIGLRMYSLFGRNAVRDLLGLE